MARLATPSIIAVFVLTLATSVSAETRAGLQAGVNLASIRVTPAESGFTFSTLTRPGVGGLVDVGLDDRLSVHLEAKVRGKAGDEETDQDAKDDFKKLDFGLGLGGGVRVPVGRASLFVEGRYVLGLWNVTNDTYNSKLRTKGYQVGAGLTFLSFEGDSGG